MKKGRDKRIVSVLMTLTIIFTLMGGTLSYLRWQTSEGQKTNVVFTVNQDFSCAADGGGNIASASLMPASCTNPKYAIQRTVTVTPEIKVDNINVVMDLWLDINTLGSGLSRSEYFKYALTTEENNCTTGIVSQGRFTGLSSENNDKVMLLNQQEYSTSEPKTYYLYIWIDPLESNNYILEQPFNFSLGGSCTSVEIATNSSTYTEYILNGTDPELESGMIPVTISDTGAVTVADTTKEWYSYEDKDWANAVLVNSTSRSTYINQDGTFNANTPIPESNILAYYVWIPRYKYTFPKADGNPETISIIFENNQTTKSIPTSGKASGTDYYTHPAFTFGDKELNGIWVGKFETTGDATTPTILPDESSLRGGYIIGSGGAGVSYEKNNQNIISLKNLTNKNNITQLDQDSYLKGMSDFFDVALKFSGGTRNGSIISFTGNNTYGLINTTDSHMMKNSEWGAVAYLSHSIYGKNTEITINNNSNYITGSGDGTYYGSPIAGDYTYPQSTTGNISGIFDMSGGTHEFVMGKSAEPGPYDYSGFSGLPSLKYYDKYTVTSNANCTLSECGGHALYETEGWYSDYTSFVNIYALWFMRGGSGSGASVGAFNSTVYNGDAYDNGFRAVLVKGT